MRIKIEWRLRCTMCDFTVYTAHVGVSQDKYGYMRRSAYIAQAELDGVWLACVPNVRNEVFDTRSCAVEFVEEMLLKHPTWLTTGSIVAVSLGGTNATTKMLKVVKRPWVFQNGEHVIGLAGIEGGYPLSRVRFSNDTIYDRDALNAIKGQK